MCLGVSRLTVLFEEPFWIGLYEREEDGSVKVCKITFGAEPKDYEVYAFLLQNWGSLRFSAPVKGTVPDKLPGNPKRMRRRIQRQLQNTGVGTKAQQALQLQREQGKEERVARLRAKREDEKEKRYALRREKRREKHRGH